MSRKCSVCGLPTEKPTCEDAFCGANTVAPQQYRFTSPRTGNKSIKELPDDIEAVEYSMSFDDVLQASIEKWDGTNWVELQ